MPVTPLYAALLAVLFLVLSIATIKGRQRNRVSLGDGGHSDLARAIRVHGNFAEYVPMTLVLMLALESLNGPSPWLHLPGLLLLAGRAVHAFGVSQQQEKLVFRVAGMMMTFLAMVLCIIGIGARYLLALA
ncbi:MAPEG family protein [Gallaecimonas xiamenensis]|uniref:Eicosanoid and glutathione metabolism membrane protein n=1 Tax=Gallaecimonas xiamenensis 3-C-1 TaxID=745411 RepID=K2JPR3_9GAMM|nr:MAPEG family protein [Gallaecimonas xiamenensis]EKE77178.1 eicosanoid and glutathione metabolism membrane protein [Gallaecimonas xiamenensis 3-C-1]